MATLLSCCATGGQIRRLVLSNKERTKLNVAPDADFYSFPRLVTHVDDAFTRRLTAVYEERIPPGAEVLDLMSSWVSHLPPSLKFKRVVGHGMNARELAMNKQLDYFVVKDINQDTKFEFPSQSFDAVVCAVSVQYMQRPEEVFAEVYRVLRPGGVCIVSFSNRMFFDKAIAAWRDGNDYSRVQLVVQYFQCIVGFTQPEVLRPGNAGSDSFWSRLFGAVQGRDPFYAVISYRNFKPEKM